MRVVGGCGLGRAEEGRVKVGKGISLNLGERQQQDVAGI